MRRRLALLAALSVALVLPTSASGARATRLTDHSVNLSCEGINPTSGTGFAFFGASVSEVNGSDAFLDAWNADQPVGPPDVSRDYGQPAAVTWDGTTLSGSFPLVDSGGIAVGSASFSAAMTPVGDPFPINDSFKDGNHKYQATGTGQALQPAGTLILTTGPTFDLAGCTSELDTISVFATNPASLVAHFAARSVGCDITDAAGNTGSLFVTIADTDSFVDALVFPASAASPDLEAFGSGTIVGGTFDASLDVVFAADGQPAGVPGSIHMTLTSTSEKFQVIMQDGIERRVTRGTLLDIEGTLSIGTYTFDLGACVGVDYRLKRIVSAHQGPKPGGKAPANDLPSGAKLLAIGGSATVQTKGASPDREAPFDCLTFEDPPGTIFEVPVANTVWYRFTGTGNPVTVDTAGSDFDTVLAVYTSNGAGGFTPVANGCDDDVPVQPFGRTLQAAVTIPTVAGTSYYVQIGGFPSTFPYGNLRVSVR